MTGRIIGHYRLIDKLGEGGMGKVYRAIDTMVEREVALKGLKPELAARPEVLERFRSEATTLARLNHPNVAQLYAFFKDGNEFYMVMEFVPGKTLEAVIQEGGAMPWRRALEIAAQVLDGIDHAHQLGILHRDVKPANIILLDQGKGTGGFQPAAKIMDFGIAQALGSSRLTREGHLIGTLEYLAPERIQGKSADARSDLYSMAVVLYEMLTGKLPFQSDSEYSLLLAQVQKQPPRPREWVVDLPPDVEQTLLRALEKDPARRYPSASAFAAALRQHIAIPGGAAASTGDYGLGQIADEVLAIVREVPPPVELVTRLRSAFAAAWRDTTFKVLMACGIVLLLALSTLLGVVLFRRTMPQTEVASTEEPAPTPAAPAAEQRPAPAVVPDAPIFPTTPMPIDQILGGAPRSADEQSPAADPPGPQESPSTTKPVVTPRTPVPAAPAVAQPESPWSEVAAALDTTDGPATGAGGEWPIHRAGLLAALRLARGSWQAELVREVERRGVNFLLTPSSDEALRSAGAGRALMQAVDRNLRSAAVSAVKEPAEPASKPKPEPRDIRRLRDVKTLYIERMKSDLDEMLRAEIKREFGARLMVLSEAAAADARMSAEMEENEGGFFSGAGRVLGLKDKYRLIVHIRATHSRRDLWQHETGDKSPIVGAFGSKAMGRAVSRIVGQLREDMED